MLGIREWEEVLDRIGVGGRVDWFEGKSAGCLEGEKLEGGAVEGGWRNEIAG
jgi:hypothetical protein